MALDIASIYNCVVRFMIGTSDQTINYVIQTAWFPYVHDADSIQYITAWILITPSCLDLPAIKNVQLYKILI